MNTAPSYHHALFTDLGLILQVTSDLAQDRLEVLRSRIENIKPDIIFFSDNLCCDANFFSKLNYRPNLIAGFLPQSQLIAMASNGVPDLSSFDLVVVEEEASLKPVSQLGARGVAFIPKAHQVPTPFSLVPSSTQALTNTLLSLFAEAAHAKLHGIDPRIARARSVLNELRDHGSNVTLEQTLQASIRAGGGPENYQLLTLAQGNNQKHVLEAGLLPSPTPTEEVVDDVVTEQEVRTKQRFTQLIDLMHSGEWQSAHQIAEALILEFPEITALNHANGMCLKALNQSTKALRAFARELELDPQNEESQQEYNEISTYLVNKGRETAIQKN